MKLVFAFLVRSEDSSKHPHKRPSHVLVLPVFVSVVRLLKPGNGLGWLLAALLHLNVAKPALTGSLHCHLNCRPLYELP